MSPADEAPIVGTPLAAQVADALENGRLLAYRHPYYCGMGLRFADGVFLYGEVHDAQLLSPSELESLGVDCRDERLTFATRDDFIRWLSAQTDMSLSGHHLADTWLHDNQRLTIARLERFVQGLPA